MARATHQGRKATLQSAAGATGIGTVMDVSEMAVVAVQLTISASATVTFEASIGGTMTALPATNLATGAVATTATATGIYLCNVAGLSAFQTRISTFGSGTITAIASALSVAGGALAGALGSSSTTLTNFAAAVAAADAMAKPTTAPALSWLVGYNGATGDLVRVASVSYDMNAIAITTVATVATPASGKQIRLMGGSFSVSAACSVLFENNAAAGTKIFRTPKLLADTPYNFDLSNGVLVSTANNVLKATASTGTVTITGTLRGTEE